MATRAMIDPCRVRCNAPARRLCLGGVLGLTLLASTLFAEPPATRLPADASPDSPPDASVDAARPMATRGAKDAAKTTERPLKTGKSNSIPKKGSGSKQGAMGSGRVFPFDPSRMLESFLGPADPQELADLQRVEIDLEEERRWGAAATEALLADFRRRDIAVSRDGRDVAYLQKLVEQLRPRMKHADRYPKIRVLVAGTDWTDARSLPGGTLVFFRGLLEFAGSEAALVGVVGHELSHLDRGHQLHDLRRLAAAKQRFSNAAAGDPAALFADGMAFVRGFARPFRPEEETEADRDAVAWMMAAGYDPKQLADLFRRWDRREGRRGAEPPAMLEFLRSHPPHAERHADVLAAAARWKAPPQGNAGRLYIGTRNLRERVTRDERRFPE
jgi:Zn-dependent protease with chaperone function